jgi:hypothetical protein
VPGSLLDWQPLDAYATALLCRLNGRHLWSLTAPERVTDFRSRVFGTAGEANGILLACPSSPIGVTRKSGWIPPHLLVLRAALGELESIAALALEEAHRNTRLLTAVCTEMTAPPIGLLADSVTPEEVESAVYKLDDIPAAARLPVMKPVPKPKEGKTAHWDTGN